MRGWIILGLLALNSNAYGQVILLLCRLSTINLSKGLFEGLSACLSKHPLGILLSIIRLG